MEEVPKVVVITRKGRNHPWSQSFTVKQSHSLN